MPIVVMICQSCLNWCVRLSMTVMIMQLVWLLFLLSCVVVGKREIMLKEELVSNLVFLISGKIKLKDFSFRGLYYIVIVGKHVVGPVILMKQAVNVWFCVKSKIFGGIFNFWLTCAGALSQIKVILELMGKDWWMHLVLLVVWV